MIELRAVTKRFGAVRVLAGVEASLAPGRVAVITGANGSGKSTLLAIIGTVMRPTSGSVHHGDLGSDAGAVRAQVGWIGHDTLAYGDLTGRENLELTARLYGIDTASAVLDARARFALDGFLDRPVRTYSRGQRQRVALARALVHRPRLLLLDEPTAGLDVASTETLSRIVREEAARGAWVVLSTHDPALARLVGDDFWSLRRGKLTSSSADVLDQGVEGARGDQVLDAPPRERSQDR
jgi:heme ABC exporter ATP-binding subunit CcmA